MSTEQEIHGVECECGWCGVVDVVDDVWMCPFCGYVQELEDVEPDPDEAFVRKMEDV